MNTLCLSFNELSLKQLYEVMKLRQEVFVVEQDCPYLDADDKDQLSHHLLIYVGEKLAAYTRLVPPGVSYPKYSSIGRVVTRLAFRGKGIGQSLMKNSISRCIELFPNNSIKISAQCYLEKFYTDLGFQDLNLRYLEDNIPHMAMLYKID